MLQSKQSKQQHNYKLQATKNNDTITSSKLQKQQHNCLLQATQNNTITRSNPNPEQQQNYMPQTTENNNTTTCSKLHKTTMKLHVHDFCIKFLSK